MTFWTYILRCSDGGYYTGHTDDLEKRIAQHQAGEIEGCTRKRRPVKLMWSEGFGTREEALAAELRVKNWSRAKKEALIANDWRKLSEAAIPPGERHVRASASLGSAPRLRSGRTDISEASTSIFGASTPVRVERSRDALPSKTEGSEQSTSVRVERSRDTLPSKAEGSEQSTSVRVERSRDALPSKAEGSEQADMCSPHPAIVLVRPQLGENIGKAARAMLNFGLADLRLVNPRDGWPNPAAGPAASGADVVLERARLFESVQDAVADCAHVYATTVRKRGLVLPVVTPEDAAREIRARAEPAAILFGAERSGLETDEAAIAHKILTVPINPEFRSLNLAQAVILVAYEWSKHGALAVPTEGGPAEPRAPHAHLEGLIGQMTQALDAVGYFFPPDRTPATLNTLRTILTKPGWSSREIQALRGMVRAITHPRRRG